LRWDTFWKLVILAAPVGMAAGLWAHLLVYGPLPGPEGFGRLFKRTPRLERAEVGDQIGLPEAVVHSRGGPAGEGARGRRGRERTQGTSPEMLSPYLQEVLEDAARHRRLREQVRGDDLR
jgi:hypothetical protein